MALINIFGAAMKTNAGIKMSNHYFQFKQFTIQQEQCAMKVTTDACLFGAFVAQQIINCQLPIVNLLDIGTGTGLLSLMLAQKTNTLIDAVEIDEASCKQATKNIEQSPWKEQLNIFNADILKFDSDKNMIPLLPILRFLKTI